MMRSISAPLTSSNEDQRVSFLSKKYGISSAEVRGLIGRFGTNEKMLDAAVMRLKSSR